MFRYFLPFLLLLMVGCSSKKVETDYDPGFVTTQLKTYVIIHADKAGQQSLDSERIREAITLEMKRKGYETVSQDRADFHITFQNAVEEDVPSNFSFGFGVGTYSGGSGASVGTTRNVTSDKETLFINMVDPKTKKTFWRATNSNKRRSYKSPQERTDHIDKIVATMLTTFPARGQ